jgi:predicted O-methyltransferase YrrM
MTEDINQPIPKHYFEIDEATKASGFTMASDMQTCCLLRTLAASKPSAKFLELGTGTGLSTAWILDGMDKNSTLVSIDNEKKFQDIAARFLGDDQRLNLTLTDGGDWVQSNKEQKYDYIFADTWHGKFLLLDDVLAMLNNGGLYIIDDMIPVATWPEGHQEKVTNLISYLDSREDLVLTKQVWATGIMVAAKK